MKVYQQTICSGWQGELQLLFVVVTDKNKTSSSYNSWEEPRWWVSDRSYYVRRIV